MANKKIEKFLKFRDSFIESTKSKYIARGRRLKPFDDTINNSQNVESSTDSEHNK